MKSRTKNVFLNIRSNFISLIVKTIFTFITRTVFIYCLGKEQLGISGLFTNILYMLSLAELGIGTAINFSLYEPLSKNDNKKISILMSFYKKAYRIIGMIILSIGIILIPFLKYLINDIQNIDNVYFIYLLFLINTVSIYFISYKDTLIVADQKKYKLVKLELISLISINTLQIIFLFLTHNFIIYLLIQIIVQIIERILINYYIGKQYREIDFNCKEHLKKKDSEIISKNIKAMFFHKIGDYCINGTDNLIISSFINIATVGVYSNYTTIITMLNSFIFMIYNNLTSSLGNLLVTANNEKKYDIFKKMNFISLLIYGFCSLILMNIFNDFITVWIGKEYCLNFILVIIIVINFYLVGMRVSSNIIKNAAGEYDVDKYTPFIQSIVNLVVSIILVRKIGLLGVLIGTLVSSVVLPNWQKPYIVYKKILKVSCKEYFKTIIKFTFILAILIFLTTNIYKIIIFENILITICFKILCSSLLYLCVIIFIYRNTSEFKYVEDILIKNWKEKLCTKKI